MAQILFSDANELLSHLYGKLSGDDGSEWLYKLRVFLQGQDAVLGDEISKLSVFYGKPFSSQSLISELPLSPTSFHILCNLGIETLAQAIVMSPQFPQLITRKRCLKEIHKVFLLSSGV